MPESLLKRVIILLVEPQDPINIGTTIRAMKNMGAEKLRLVNPVAYDPYRLIGVAHDTHEIIDGIEHYDSVGDAISDCVRVAGFTARRRAARRGIINAAEAAEDLIQFAGQGNVALMFGREDKGLPNDALDLAQLVVTIPTTDHASLNLSQAVLIALYELHTRANDATRTLAPPSKLTDPPTSERLEMFFTDAYRALEAIDFFKTRNEEHVMRSLRSLIYRAQPDSREVDFIRAMSIEVLRTIDRERRKKVEN